MQEYLEYQNHCIPNYGCDTSNLKPMEQIKIVCGKKYGLPFEYLMTDVMSGCLPIESVCYGNCTAALYWVKQGYDFGKRVLNKFDESLFRTCIQDLPKEQKWLRQGWVSDCSFSNESWQLTSQVSDILAQYKIHLMIITKIHTIPNPSILQNLAKNKVEIRVSLSALDTKSSLERRLDFLSNYRKAGGIAVPYLMTAKYQNKILKGNQDFIIDFIVANDFIAGEHPLRISKNNSIIRELESDGFFHPKYTDQYWFGRILNHIPNFILPPPTHVKPEYHLHDAYFSKIPSDKQIEGIGNNLPTYNDLQNNIYSKELFDHAAYSIQEFK